MLSGQAQSRRNPRSGIVASKPLRCGASDSVLAVSIFEKKMEQAEVGQSPTLLALRFAAGI